jgi:hypothetical protein
MRNGAGYKLIAKGEKINRTKRCTSWKVGIHGPLWTKKIYKIIF